MAFYKHDNGIYWADFTVNGVRYRKRMNVCERSLR